MNLLGFTIVEQMQGAIFMRAAASDNHHDLGLFSTGENSAPSSRNGQVGLYHLAWEVETIQELPSIRTALQNADAFIGESDHGNSLSLYAKDPDGIEFEVFWMVPVEEWESRGFGTRRLQLEQEIARRTGTTGT
jgi:catechol-2,3-dioxygenase